MAVISRASRQGFIRKTHFEAKDGTPSKGPDAVSAFLLDNGDECRAEYCRRSLPYFMHTFWDVIVQDELVWNWHIGYFADELMEIARRVADRKPKDHDLIINVPPGTTKSLTASVMFPVWCWTNWYWMRFIAASYSAALALEQAELSRDIIRSDKFRRLFPNLTIKQDKDTKSNFRMVWRGRKVKDGGEVVQLGGNRYSTSVGGTLTGFHGHILIVDDPVDPKRAVSDVELKAANRWVDHTLSTRKVDKAVTPTVVIMQRLHQNDPTGHILAKEKGNVRHISLPGEIREYADKVLPPELKERYVDGLLDEKRMPWLVLEEMKKDLGQYGYAGQVGQSPVPPSGGMFKVAFLERAIVDVVPGSILFTVRAWDKAGTAGGGKCTVGLKMCKLRESKKYVILDVKRGQWDSAERERIILSTAEMDGRGVTVYVEQEPGSGGKESAEGTKRNLAGFVVYAVSPMGDKVYRADPASVAVNNGDMMLLRGLWNKDFIEELRYFPFSTYKDQVDALSLAFKHLARKRVAGPVLK